MFKKGLPLGLKGYSRFGEHFAVQNTPLLKTQFGQERENNEIENDVPTYKLSLELMRELQGTFGKVKFYDLSLILWQFS